MEEFKKRRPASNTQDDQNVKSVSTPPRHHQRDPDAPVQGSHAAAATANSGAPKDSNPKREPTPGAADQD